MTFMRALLVSLVMMFAVSCGSSSKKPADDKKPDPTGTESEAPEEEAMPAGDAPDMKEKGGEDEDDDMDKGEGGSRGIGAEPEEEEPPGATGDDG